MQKYEAPMMVLGSLFAIVMAVLGWRSALLTHWDPAVVVICAIASCGVLLVGIGWHRSAMMWVASGALCCAVLFPTPWGLVPMVIGFVIFMMILGLRLFEMIDEKEK